MGLNLAGQGPWRRGWRQQPLREDSEAGSGGRRMHLGAPYGLSGCWEAEDRGSAQTLVQVGRGEEGVGGQAHSQEAPDQEGAKTTSPGGGLV